MSRRNPDYQPGQPIPGTVYRVHRIIGAGGMGTVYDVEDTSVGRRYVLKTLHSDLADRADLALRLSREARALAKLQHPNIVEVYTSGTTKDHLKLPYYVMERLQGQSLREVLDRKGRLTVQQACDICIDLLDALDHAHEFGIVHRDVKPDNIFITRGKDGRSLAKLLDFGVIKLAQSNSLHTGARFIGTFRYAPPEQILGREVTGRSDLYAAALVLYEMLGGRGPFDDFAGEVEIGKAHVDVAAPPLSRFVSVPHDLEQLIASALSKRPEDRPKDAYTFSQALGDIKRRVMSTGQDAHEQQTVDAMVSIAAPSGPAPISPAAPSPVQSNEQPSTRVDARDGMLAATQMAQNGTAIPATPKMANTPQNQASTQAQPRATLRWESPPIAGPTSGPTPNTLASPNAPNISIAGPQLSHPHPARDPSIDRRAETRAAEAPPNRGPNYDTQPIPLVSSAPPADVVEPFARPESRNETFGPTATDASKPRGSRASLVVVISVLLALSSVVAVGVYALKKRSNEIATSRPSATTSASAAVISTTTATIATITNSVSSVPSATVPASPMTTSAVTPPPPPARTKPIHTAPTTTPTLTATTPPKPTATSEISHRLPGSGL